MTIKRNDVICLKTNCEWGKIKLGDACEKIGSGVTPRGGENVYQDAGVSLIRSQNIYDFNFDYNGLAYIDDQQAKKCKMLMWQRAMFC